jgi:hypothetical protein
MKQCSLNQEVSQQYGRCARSSFQAGNVILTQSHTLFHISGDLVREGAFQVTSGLKKKEVFVRPAATRVSETWTLAETDERALGLSVWENDLDENIWD